MDSSEYRPFWISWMDGKIEVGYGLIVRNTLSRLIVWDDPEPLNITEIKVSSKPEGSCIVHYPTGTVKMCSVLKFSIFNFLNIFFAKIAKRTGQH